MSLTSVGAEQRVPPPLANPRLGQGSSRHRLSPMTILDEIMAHKRRVELPGLPAVDRRTLDGLAPCRGFEDALRRGDGDPVRIIAESKKGSPSCGILRQDYDPVLNAYAYLTGGAAAMSVLTDQRYFYGAIEDLIAVRGAVDLPLLCKDFVIDERQIAAARLAGADCILLIAAVLEDGQIRDLRGCAGDLGLDVLVEVHDDDEAARAVAQQATMIGVNNRDLHTFTTDLATTYALVDGLRRCARVVVSESGIRDRADAMALEAAGVDALLVGETLMRHDDPASALLALRGALR